MEWLEIFVMMKWKWCLMIKKIIKSFLIMMVLFLVITSIYILKVYVDYRNLIVEKPLGFVVETVRKKENYTQLENISKDYLEPLIASEDRRFHQRSGIDLRALLRATLINLKKGELVQGGSTIPQQVAKSLYFDHVQTIDEMIMQVFIMYDLENLFLKEDILELYINNIYYGAGYYSIYEASVGYFGVEPNNLNVNQGSLLTAILPAPTVYNPRNNYGLAKFHQRRVLFDLVEVGLLTPDEANLIHNTDINIKK